MSEQTNEAQPVDVLAVMDRAEVDLREVADHYCAEPIMADELREARAAVAELVDVANRAALRLESLADIFNGPRFTDRYGDGPECAKRAEELRAALARVGGAP